MLHSVYLSLGSNLGDSAAQLLEAIEQLGQLGTVVSVSSFYETEPVEFTAQPWFLNCAVRLDTSLAAEALMADILEIEQRLGRRRDEQKGPRTVDIDILLYGKAKIARPGLTIPHPAMPQRRFVLEPLAEIAPKLWHPVLERTVEELRDQLPRGQAVRKKLIP
jgi:2-amino-4-hydroxy-6-hydroxymethyldihydropteridine diphosphokinase